jgi:hypothetical protein
MEGHKTDDSARYSARLALIIWFAASGAVWLVIAIIAARL